MGMGSWSSSECGCMTCSVQLANPRINMANRYFNDFMIVMLKFDMAVPGGSGDASRCRDEHGSHAFPQSTGLKGHEVGVLTGLPRCPYLMTTDSTTGPARTSDRSGVQEQCEVGKGGERDSSGTVPVFSYFVPCFSEKIRPDR